MKMKMSPAIGMIILLLAATSIFLFFLKNPVAFDDALSHFAFARMMRLEGMFPAQGWDAFLSEGVMSRISVNPYFLSHVLMIPLTVLPPVLALKLISIVLIAFVLLCMWTLLRPLIADPRSHAWLLFFFLLGNHIFFGRTLLARPFTLLTGLYILLLFTIIQRKWIATGVILALAVLTSHLFVFLLAAALVAVPLLLLQKRPRDAALITGAIILGTGAGLILHPQTAGYLTYLSDVFLRLPFLGTESEVTELQSGVQKNLAGLLSWISVVAVIGLSGLAARSLSKKDRRAHPELMYAAILTLGLLPCYILWIRAMDFLWPTLILLLATSWGAFLKTGRELKLPFDRRLSLLSFDLLSLFCILQTILVGSTILTRNPQHDLHAYSAVETLPPESTALNMRWDRLPVLTVLRPDVHYVLGMDPRFLELENPALHRLIQEGNTRSADATWKVDTWLTAVRKEIDIDAIIVDRPHTNLIDHLHRSKMASPLSETGALAVFSLTR